MIGQVIADRFHILDRIGEGGMGRVYLAEHVRMGRKCAVKMINPSMAASADAITRFNREAANASRINHPNVAQIYDFGETADGALYLAMEYIEGESLTSLIHRERALPIARAADIAMQAAHGLAAAHHLGIVHRDLKPDNILVARHLDGSDWVKVVDFGIAKTVEGGGAGSQALTTVGVSLGTPEYMSPEQLAGEKLDHRTDIYSLGLVLFNTLTVDLPYPRVTSKETLIRRLTTPAQTLSDVRPDRAWPESIQMVMDRALAAEPTDRFASANEFGQALTAVIEETGDPGRTMQMASIPRMSSVTATTPRAATVEPTVPVVVGVLPQLAPPVRESSPTRPMAEDKPRRKVGMIAAMVVLIGGSAAAAVMYATHGGPSSAPTASGPSATPAVTVGDTAVGQATAKVDTAKAAVPGAAGASATPSPTSGAAPAASKQPATPTANTAATKAAAEVAVVKPAVDSTSTAVKGDTALTPPPAPPATVATVAAGRGRNGGGRAARNPDAVAKNGAGGAGGGGGGRAAVAGAAHPWLAANGDSTAPRVIPPNATNDERLQFAEDEIHGHVARETEALQAGDATKARTEYRNVIAEVSFARTYFGTLPRFQMFENAAFNSLRLANLACQKAVADSLFKNKPLPQPFNCNQLAPARVRGGGPGGD